MAVIAGQRFTYSDTVNEAIDISSALDKLKPVDTPLLLRIGRDSLRDECVAVKHEWLEDTIRGTTTNDVGGTFNNTTDPVTVTVTAGDGNTKFRINDILKVEQELVRVTATAANTITVTRAWGGSTNAAHASGILITLLAPAMPQGSDLAGARTTTKSGLFNYTQIFEEEVKVAKTMQATDKYTKQNDPEYQIGSQLEIIGVNMERTLLFGRKQQPTSTLPGSMDGIQVRISTNVYNKASAALSQSHLEDAMEAIWQAGGRPSLIVTNSTQQRRINSFLDGYREADYEDEVLGTMVRRYKTNFGTVDILLDRHMPADEVWVLDEDKIGFGPLRTRALSTMRLPPVSKEYDVWQISGEYTSETRLEQGHARIFGLATTGIF
jgi:hypothetical protein